MGENFATTAEVDAIPLKYAPVVPNGFDAVTKLIVALVADAPALAQVVPGEGLGLGINVAEPVWLVCEPVPVPKSCVDICPHTFPPINPQPLTKVSIIRKIRRLAVNIIINREVLARSIAAWPGVS
jgi:hypothetical protein